MEIKKGQKQINKTGRIRHFMQLKMPAGYDKVIHACIIILLIFGSVMVVSTSVGDSATDHFVVYRTIIKQIIFVALSYFLMDKAALHYAEIYANRKGYTNMMKLIAIAIILMLAACQLFPGANGSKAWIYIPGTGTSLQPSEFAKTYYIILFGATASYYLNQVRVKHKHITFWDYMKYPLICFLIFIVLIAAQPDFGTIVVLTLIAGALFLIPRNASLTKSQVFMRVLFILLFILIVFLMSKAGMAVLEKFLSDYKLKRFTDAANPFKNIYDTGYNLVYSLYAIANGGLTGLGIGASEQKFGYLPEAQTDFILSVTIEELGIWGLLIIVVCYGFIIYRLIYWAMHSQNDGFRVILVGCALYLGIHFILNVGGVSGLIPLTGVPLLFMSAGGSSLLSIMILLGVCQSVISKIRMNRNQYNRDGLIDQKRMRERGML